MNYEFMAIHLAEAIYDCYLLLGIDDSDFIIRDLHRFYPTVTTDVMEEAFELAQEWLDIGQASARVPHGFPGVP